MAPKRIALIAGAVLLLALIIWDQWRRAPEIQVPATFARLSEAIAGHDTSGVMACVDRSYDFSAKWPNLFGSPESARDDAKRLLAMAFLSTREEQNEAPYTVHSVTPQPDGSVVAVVSLAVTGGRLGRAMPALDHLRFTLVKGSWLSGRYRISDHAPFALDVPGQ